MPKIILAKNKDCDFCGNRSDLLRTRRHTPFRDDMWLCKYCRDHYGKQMDKRLNDGLRLSKCGNNSLATEKCD